MPDFSEIRIEQVDAAFSRWERLRRRLYERESAWASAVTRTSEPQRLLSLSREVARLRRVSDGALQRAMSALEVGVKPESQAARGRAC